MQLQRFEQLKRDFESAAKRWYAAEELDQRLALLREVRNLTQELAKLVLQSDQEWRKKQVEYERLVRNWKAALATGRHPVFAARNQKPGKA